jgi:hypothetical protein
VVKKEAERLERARIEKKIAEIQKKKGISNLKQLKNLDALLKEESVPNWNFNIEKKTYKDTIEISHGKEHMKTKSTLGKTGESKF